MSVRIITLNVCGLGNTTKRRAIFNYYRNKCDVLCIQESHSTSEIENIWQNKWGGKIIITHYLSTSRGCAMLLNPKFEFSIDKVWTDNDGRIIVCEGVKNDQ